MAWMTIRDGVERMNGAVSYATVRRLALSGEVKSTRVRGRILLDTASFDEMVKNNGYALIAPARRRVG